MAKYRLLIWLKVIYRKPLGFLIKKRNYGQPDNEHITYNIHDVFGITNEISRVYTSRSYVDDQFKKALIRRKHIVIYGCSKQGKTSLRKKYLDSSNSVVIQCTNLTTRNKIYELILKEAGIELSSSKSESMGETSKIGDSLSGESNLHIVKTKVSTNTSYEENTTDTITKNYFQIDTTDINDIIRALASTNTQMWIVIEDFHYLSDKEQLQLASDLKAIYENTSLIRVIIIGVWLETDRITKLNGDLEGRISYVNADVWKQKELLKVIEEGEKLLNIFFTHEAKQKIIFYCKNNVGLLHQIVEKICDEVGITKTQSKSLLILDDPEIRSIPKLIVDFDNSEFLSKYNNRDEYLLEFFGVKDVQKFENFNYHGGSLNSWLEELSRDRASRYWKFIKEFADGPSSYNGEIYRLILYSVIKASHEELLHGLTLNLIRKHNSDIFDIDIPKKELRNALHGLKDFHSELKVQPPIFDFDETIDALKVVDSGLLLYRATHSARQMLAVIGMDN